MWESILGFNRLRIRALSLSLTPPSLPTRRMTSTSPRVPSNPRSPRKPSKRPPFLGLPVEQPLRLEKTPKRAAAPRYLTAALQPGQTLPVSRALPLTRWWGSSRKSLAATSVKRSPRSPRRWSSVVVLASGHFTTSAFRSTQMQPIKNSGSVKSAFQVTILCRMYF